MQINFYDVPFSLNSTSATQYYPNRPSRDNAKNTGHFHSMLQHTENNILLLTWIHITTNWFSSWIFANRRILLKLADMLIQHNRSFSDSCIYVNHVYRTWKNEKDVPFGDGRITSLCESLSQIYHIDILLAYVLLLY